MNLSSAPSRSGARDSTSTASNASNMALRSSTAEAPEVLPPPPSNMTPFYLNQRTDVRLYRGFTGALSLLRPIRPCRGQGPSGREASTGGWAHHLITWEAAQVSPNLETCSP